MLAISLRTGDNDNWAEIVCRELGFVGGVGYTFGFSRLLPTLPIVVGFRTCEGTESNIFLCPEQSNSNPPRPIDRDCWIGCRGADGVSGTADDSVDPTCTHAIDQGVICSLADSPQRRNAANTDPCHGGQVGGRGIGGAGCDATLVANGVLESDPREAGGGWESGSDSRGAYLTQNGPGTFLRWAYDLGTDDFTVDIALTLTELDGSAATFEINGDSHFGFEGACQCVFVEGPFFGDMDARRAMGQDDWQVGLPADFGILEGVEADFQVRRRGNAMQFYWNGQLVLDYNTANRVTQIGLRPHRATIKLYDWQVSLPQTKCTTNLGRFENRQPISFSCVEYYSTNCIYDVTNTELSNGLGSYMRAMRAFAECAEVIPEPVGYCHDSIDNARYLSNHEVCAGEADDDPSTPDVDEGAGATTDIGFREWLRFRVLQRHSPSDPRLVARHSNSVPRER